MFAITERLLLRPGWPEDAPALSRAIGVRDAACNLALVPWPYVERDADQYLCVPHDPLRPRFLICLRADHRLIGGIGLHGDDVAELGFWIAPHAWGNGFATEAGRAVLALADSSLRLPRIGARHTPDNPASGRVLSKLGFRPTGKTRLTPTLARGVVEARLSLRSRDESAQALAA